MNTPQAIVQRGCGGAWSHRLSSPRAPGQRRNMEMISAQMPPFQDIFPPSRFGLDNRFGTAL
jgi:hypothetical protein